MEQNLSMKKDYNNSSQYKKRALDYNINLIDQYIPPFIQNFRKVLLTIIDYGSSGKYFCDLTQ